MKPRDCLTVATGPQRGANAPPFGTLLDTHQYFLGKPSGIANSTSVGAYSDGNPAPKKVLIA